MTPDNDYRREAIRLARLAAGERAEALAVHRRIADDPSLSATTRSYARRVLDTLERHLQRLAKKKEKSL